MSTLNYAQQYIRRGWAPVPIPAHQKGPRIRGWQNLRITDLDAPHYFKGEPNVGIILGAASNGLTDLDLDCAEAIELATIFMPPTHAIFGRASKPRSHWLYRVEGTAPTLKLSDPTSGDMILEIRGDGGLQTVFPGSTHPSNELIEWEAEGQPAVIDVGTLCKRAKWLAAACLVRRYCGHVKNYAEMLASLAAADQRVARQVHEWFGIPRVNPINEHSVNQAAGGHGLGPKPPWLTRSPWSVNESLTQSFAGLDETQWNPAAEARLRSALRAIPAMKRDIWLRVGMALHATGWANAFAIWDEWSRACPEKYNAADQQKTWDSFRGPGERASITLATVFHLAREHGWTEERIADASNTGPNDAQPNDAPKDDNDEAARRRDFMMSAAELRTMRFDPVPYVLPGFVVEGLTLLVGRPKIGKSF